MSLPDVSDSIPEQPAPRRRRRGFGDDFRRFFTRGLAALLPTLITLSVLIWAWGFLWESIGQHLIWVVKNIQFYTTGPAAQWGLIDRRWEPPLMRPWVKQLIGVSLAIVLVYLVGLLVGNLIGRTFWRVVENLVMKVPIVRAIYPAVKQVTDFVLSDRKSQFEASRVVAVEPHEKGIWTIGLVTGPGVRHLSEAVGEEMVSVFCPNSPMAFSGYVLVCPRSSIIELPITVEEALRLLVSGGVIEPGSVEKNAKTLRELVGGAVKEAVAVASTLPRGGREK